MRTIQNDASTDEWVETLLPPMISEAISTSTHVPKGHVGKVHEVRYTVDASASQSANNKQESSDHTHENGWRRLTSVLTSASSDAVEHVVAYKV